MRLLVIVAITGLWAASGLAQGIEFFHGSWEEALQEAQKQEKVIFVDAYATWCGPCKRMSREVFPNEKVGEFFNQHFINMKLDMEKGEGLSFRKSYPVSAFPTLFFISGDGEVVQKVRGAQDVNGFLQLGQKVLSMSSNTEEYATQYEAGERDPELVYKYVKALNNAGESSLRVANEYLDEQENLNTLFNLRFLLEATTEADSKIFSMMIERREQIEELEGKEAVRQKILRACRATVNKAIEFQHEGLLEGAVDKMQKHYPEKADAFELSSQMEFYRAMGDARPYVKATKKYAKKMVDGNPAELNKLASELVKHFNKDDDALKLAEDLAKEAAEQGEEYLYFLTYAHVLFLNGKNGDAREAAEKSLELARGEGPAAVMMVESFMKQMEG